MDDIKSRLFDIWFALRCGAGNREFLRVLERYGNTYDVHKAEASELESLPCSEKFKAALSDKRLDHAHEVVKYCCKSGTKILFWQDGDYPDALRSLKDPPVLLYYQGELPDLNSRLCVGVVGSRRVSEYGRRMAYKIGYELAATETVVVSGMALGVDGVAAAAAIRAGGTTVAVLGCGLDKP